MTSKTHASLGLAVGCITNYFLPVADIYVVMSASVIGSLLPDLDTQKSDPSQIFPPISKIVDRFTKHRGATHTVAPLLFIMLYMVFGHLYLLCLGLGALSHALIDYITYKLYIRCNSKGEVILYYIFWIFNVIYIINLIYQKIYIKILASL